MSVSIGAASAFVCCTAALFPMPCEFSRIMSVCSPSSCGRAAAPAATHDSLEPHHGRAARQPAAVRWAAVAAAAAGSLLGAAWHLYQQRERRRPDALALPEVCSRDFDAAAGQHRRAAQPVNRACRAVASTETAWAHNSSGSGSGVRQAGQTHSASAPSAGLPPRAAPRPARSASAAGRSPDGAKSAQE